MNFTRKNGDLIPLNNYPYQASYLVEGDRNLKPGEIIKNVENGHSYTILKSEALHFGFFYYTIAEL